jgi:hypothetical protein
MKKLIFNILLLIPICCYGQTSILNINTENDTVIVNELSINNIIDLSKIYISASAPAPDTLLLLYYNSDNVTKEGLTYNSTGDTVVSVNDNIVVIDDYDKAIVGNSIRFGDPEIGTIYTILSINVDELTLDQICTGNIGDEFFIGCDGYIEDQSIYNNDGAQAIGAYQPKGIWIETDSSRWKTDGVDDFIGITNVSNFVFAAPASVSAWVKVSNDICQSVFSVSETSTANNLFYILIGQECSSSLTNEIFSVIKRKNGSTIYIVGYTTVNRNELFDNNWHFLTLTVNGSTIKEYIDGSEVLLTVGGGSDDGSFTDINNVNDVNVGSRKVVGTRQNYFNGEIDDIRIYNKALSQPEIIQLYINSKHYNP